MTIVGSVLEHLSDQVTALASIARVTAETLVIVTPLLDSEEPVARFEPRANNPEHDYTWWTYSVGVYREVLGMLGFTIKSISQADYYHDYEQRFEPRTTLVAHARFVVSGLNPACGAGESIKPGVSVAEPQDCESQMIEAREAGDSVISHKCRRPLRGLKFS